MKNPPAEQHSPEFASQPLHSTDIVASVGMPSFEQTAYSPVQVAGDTRSLPESVSPSSLAIPAVEVAKIESRSLPRPEKRTVVHANEATFEREVLWSEEPVLVDFYADWCGPCKRLSPTLDEVAGESLNARVVKVNIEESPELANRYGVKSLPSLIVFKDGIAVSRQKAWSARIGCFPC